MLMRKRAVRGQRVVWAADGGRGVGQEAVLLCDGRVVTLTFSGFFCSIFVASHRGWRFGLALAIIAVCTFTT